MDIYLTLIPLKTCSCCGVSKEISLFNKNRGRKDGLQGRCKDCQKAHHQANKEQINAQSKAWREANPEKVKDYGKARYQANPEKFKARSKANYRANPEKFKARSKAWREANPDKKKAQCKAWREANPEKERAYKKAWREANPEKVKAQSKAWKRNRRKNDPEYKILENLRTRLWYAIKGNAKSASTQELIGCSIEFLKSHIESQFEDWMTWDNYAHDTWHIDHIKPCASFDLSDPEQQKECFHWSNLQPLGAYENFSKGARII